MSTDDTTAGQAGATDTPRLAEPKDLCPSWAVAIIHRIRELEIEHGHIRPLEDWQSAKIKDILSRTVAEEDASDEGLADTLFQRLCLRLKGEGFSPADTVSFVNGRIPTGRIPYCSTAEVLTALASS